MFKFSTVVCTYHDIMCLLKREKGVSSKERDFFPH